MMVVVMEMVRVVAGRLQSRGRMKARYRGMAQSTQTWKETEKEQAKTDQMKMLK